MKKAVRAWIAAFSLVIGWGAYAQDLPMTQVYHRLETLTGRQLSGSERRALATEHDQAQSLLSQRLFYHAVFGNLPTVLYCGRASIDLIFGGALAACVDNAFLPYYILSTGIGIGIGIQLNAFTLIYLPATYRMITGPFIGTRLSLARGLLGVSLGWFWRQNHPNDHLLWIGYATGAVVDFDATVIDIERM